MKTKKINKVIPETFQEEVITKRATISPMSIVGILLGLALIFCASFYIQDSASALYMLLMTFGVILVIYYILAISLRKESYYYKTTNSQIECYTVYYNPLERDTVLKSIEKGMVVKGLDGMEESSLKVEYVVSMDGKFAACQMYHYIPYNYVPDSGVFRVQGEKLKAIL